MSEYQVGRKSLIIGAAMAVVHQIEQGVISRDRAAGWFDDGHQKWKDYAHLQECMFQGKSPDIERLPEFCRDGLAHLRQIMRVDYDEWFEIFPWLETGSNR